MSSTTIDSAAPVTAALDRLSAAIDDVAELPVWQQIPAEQVETLAAVETLRRRLEFAQTRILAQAQESGAALAVGAPSMRAVLQARLHLDPGEAAHRVRAAGQVCGSASLAGDPVPPELPATAEAATAGEVGGEHVRVIARTLDKLPDRLDPQVRASAESTLAEHARTFAPSTLAKIGRRLLLRLDPDAAPTPDEAARKRGLRFGTDVDGMTTISGTCSDADAATIRTALDPLATPLPEIDGEKDPRTAAQRRLDALAELARRALDAGDLPTRGGERPHLTLTMSARDHAALGDASPDTRPSEPMDLAGSGPIHPDTAAWLACDCILTPIVLDDHGAPTHIGAPVRTVPAHLRRAVIARDRGCAFPGCDRPAPWCDVHHVVERRHGGANHIDNLALLCTFHHHTAVHQHGWQVEFRDRIPHFRPPPWVDPLRQPRRNHIHQTEP